MRYKLGVSFVAVRVEERVHGDLVHLSGVCIQRNEAAMDHSEPTKPSLGLCIKGRVQLNLSEPAWACQGHSGGVAPPAPALRQLGAARSWFGLPNPL